MLSGEYHRMYAGVREHESAVTSAFFSALKFYPVTAAIAKAAGLLKREWGQRAHAWLCGCHAGGCGDSERSRFLDGQSETFPHAGTAAVSNDSSVRVSEAASVHSRVNVGRVDTLPRL